MATFDGRDRLRLALMLLAGLASAGSAWLLAESAIDRTMDAAGKSTAVEWAEFLAVGLPDLENVMAQGKTSTATADFVAKTTRVGSVFRYRIFDLEGRIVLETGNGEDDEDEDEVGDDAVPAMLAAETGVVSLVSGTGNGIDRPTVYAEAYVPLRIAGRIRGTIEVYVDQTAKVAPIRSVFIWTGLGLAALIAFAFLVPVVAYLLKSREARETIAFVSDHDDLTQLSNRSAFKATVNGQIALGATFDIFSIDLDNLKTVNDGQGYDFGDTVLRLVASRLKEIAGPRGLVSRLGSDEFAVYYPVNPKGETGDSFGNRIVATLSRSYVVGGIENVIGASVGVSSSARDGKTARALLKAADIALNEAKRSGRGRLVRFKPSMAEQVQSRVALEARLRSAVANHEFEIYYQPLLNAEQLDGFEALLRLRDKNGEPIPPSVFIPVAEQVGLIDAIGAETLHEACRTAARWPNDLRIAVNLSTLQFESGDLVEIVSRALAVSSLPAQRLELEITESVLVGDAASVVRQLQELKTLGVSIALDDFGTGYSSLSYLWMFPFDRLKVDGSFICRLSATDAKARAMLASILALGRSLDMSITAEGVETPEQAEILRSMNVDTVQGFLYGVPLPEAELAGTILKLRGGYRAFARVAVMSILQKRRA